MCPLKQQEWESPCRVNAVDPAGGGCSYRVEADFLRKTRSGSEGTLQHKTLLAGVPRALRPLGASPDDGGQWVGGQRLPGPREAEKPEEG